MLMFGVAYPLLVVGGAQLMPTQANALPVEYEGSTIGFENLGQNFTDPKYFWGRPSAVDYNGAGSGASNHGNGNPVFLKEVEQRIQYLLRTHPEKNKSDIPIDLITASASGLDPHIKAESAYFQAKRVALARNIPEELVNKAIKMNTAYALGGFFGPNDYVNVLKLNLTLDKGILNEK